MLTHGRASKGKSHNAKRMLHSAKAHASLSREPFASVAPTCRPAEIGELANVAHDAKQPSSGDYAALATAGTARQTGLAMLRRPWPAWQCEPLPAVYFFVGWRFSRGG
jgi:hypothetical protein